MVLKIYLKLFCSIDWEIKSAWFVLNNCSFIKSDPLRWKVLQIIHHQITQPISCLNLFRGQFLAENGWIIQISCEVLEVCYAEVNTTFCKVFISKLFFFLNYWLLLRLLLNNRLRLFSSFLRVFFGIFLLLLRLFLDWRFWLFNYFLGRFWLDVFFIVKYFQFQISSDVFVVNFKHTDGIIFSWEYFKFVQLLNLLNQISDVT